MKALVRPSVLAVVLYLVVLNIPPGATPIYSLTFQDVTFSVDLIDSNTFRFRIQNALNASGDWTDAVSIKSFSFKDIGNSRQWKGRPGTWVYHHNELNESADCSTGRDAGKENKHCFLAPFAVALTNDMVWTIDFGSGAFNIASTGPHLKVKFLDARGKKEGRLLSKSLPLTIPPAQVPEPMTGVLLLSGLGAIKLVQLRVRRSLK